MPHPSLALEGVTQVLADGRILFSDLHERIDQRPTALVGRNGVGKSLLAAILAGRLAPTAGRCTRHGRVHYLPQQVAPAVSDTVADLAGVGPALAALARIEAGSCDPRDFVFAMGGSALLVAGGALSHQGQKRVELERMRRVYIGLAGSVAHEMRTPLAQVRHALDNIASALGTRGAGQAVALSTPQAQQMLASVQQGHEAIARGLQAIEITLKQLQPDATEQGRPHTLSAAETVRTSDHSTTNRHVVNALLPFLYRKAELRDRPPQRAVRRGG